MADVTRLQLVIVTPEKAVLDVAVDAAVLPAVDGELGVLPDRAPLISRLGPGELRLTAGSTTTRYFIDGGFAQVARRADGVTLVTVLTARATVAESISPADVAEARSNAEAMPTTTASERESRYKAQERARGLARVARV
jgi:F-type H+-transporting ATPase subunit epsilon